MVLLPAASATAVRVGSTAAQIAGNQSLVNTARRRAILTTDRQVLDYMGQAGAEIAQLVEQQLPKLWVAGSNPVFRSTVAA